MNYLDKIILAFELQDVASIKTCFENGISPNDTVNNRPLLIELVNQYPRGPKVKECVKAFVDYGLGFEDQILLSVFLDDTVALDKHLSANPLALNRKYTLDCTFTPLFEATLLHICAEYNHLACAKVLVKHGADVNAPAGFDENGFGGHTPIFHTVNQHNNQSIDVLQYLLSQSADVSHSVKGLIWGKGYEWETFIPSVNPISYAMMGLLRQFQREEKQIYEIVTILMDAAYGITYVPGNVPNRYLVNG
jgi:hypothetical protein